MTILDKIKDAFTDVKNLVTRVIDGTSREQKIEIVLITATGITLIIVGGGLIAGGGYLLYLGGAKLAAVIAAGVLSESAYMGFSFAVVAGIIGVELIHTGVRMMVIEGKEFVDEIGRCLERYRVDEIGVNHQLYKVISLTQAPLSDRVVEMNRVLCENSATLFHQRANLLQKSGDRMELELGEVLKEGSIRPGIIS